MTEVALGDRVAMPWLGYACGTCDYCVSGWETLCLGQQNTGYSIDGGFAEYAVAYARYVVQCPTASPVRRRAAHLRRRHHLQGDQGRRHPLPERVAVFGVGGLGHLAIQYARIVGGTVIAVDLNDEKLVWPRARRRAHGQRREGGSNTCMYFVAALLVRNLQSAEDEGLEVRLLVGVVVPVDDLVAERWQVGGAQLPNEDQL